MKCRSAAVAALLCAAALACTTLATAAPASDGTFAPSGFNGDTRTDLVWHNVGTGDARAAIAVRVRLPEAAGEATMRSGPA